jgi:hypothetical protein
VQDKAPVAVTARASGRDITVTVTSQSQRAQDGVVEILPSADAASEGWPAPQHFCSLAPAESRSFSIALSGAAAARQVRVRVGDREMREVMAEVTGG